MRIEKLSLRGFKRFEEAEVDLSEKVVALVGPNEAGKTSILKALSEISLKTPIEVSDLTRGVAMDGDWCVRARFRLGDEEREQASDIRLAAFPNWLIWSKKATGRFQYSFEPAVLRDKASREELADWVALICATPANDNLRKTPLSSGADGEEQLTLENGLVALLESVNEGKETLAPEILSSASKLSEAISGWSLEGREKKCIIELSAVLTTFVANERTEHPSSALFQRLSARIPDFVLFGDDDRTLNTEYPASALASPPKALSNLLQLAGVEPSELAETLAKRDHGRRSRLEETANASLAKRFVDSWTQSASSVHLQFDESTLRIQVTAPDTYSTISERSDGFRAFVALFCFLSLRKSDPKPILLVDEVESHLHYDAQRDLVRILEEQCDVEQVIYTTHSAAALPSDLGRGIRVVRPRILNRADTGRSEVDRSFWRGDGGFSPLLLAMGASTFAFCLARQVVIGEGATECILLPTLFRRASGKPVGFSIAPGLANVSPRRIEELELEAPRVAYLTDGDPSGMRLRGQLLAEGIPESRVFTLTEGRVVEDFVSARAYAEAANREIQQWNPGVGRIEVDALETGSRIAATQAECQRIGVRFPSKVRIACQVLELPSTIDLLDTSRKKELLSVWKSLVKMVGPGKPK